MFNAVRRGGRTSLLFRVVEDLLELFQGLVHGWGQVPSHLDDGGVLLARRDGGAVTGQGGVDEESLALASVTDSLEEDSMGLDVGDESGDKRNGGS